MTAAFLGKAQPATERSDSDKRGALPIFKN